MKSNLTRRELAQLINERLGIPQSNAAELVDHLFDVMKESLLAEEEVKLVQFGTFAVRKKEPRMGRNPRTGESMEICRRSMVSFRPSKNLREKINS